MKPVVAAWLVILGAFVATVFVPKSIDLWWLTSACAIGSFCAYKRPRAEAFREAFGVACLMLAMRELLQHRWL